MEKKYTTETLLQAVTAVHNGDLNISAAAKLYGIPRSTLKDKVKGKSSVHAKFGPPSILSMVEEDILVKWILHCAEKSFPVSKNQLLDSVKQLIEKLNRENPFRNNRPGRHWYEAFLKDIHY